MKIIGITSHVGKVHDNSVALLEDGEVLFAEAEERVSRIKHDGRFPWLAIKEALEYTKTDPREVNYYVSATPEQSLIRVFATSLKFIPAVGLSKYFSSVYKRIFYKVDDLFGERFPRTYLEAGLPKDKLIKISHYLAHAGTAYYFGPFDKCLVVNMDGFGPGEDGEPLSGEIYLGENGKLTPLEKVPVWGTLGLYYGAVTKALGFKLNDGEGKTMGLAAYGSPTKAYKKMKLFFPSFEAGRWLVRKSIMDILNIVRPGLYENSETVNFLKDLIAKYGRENVAASCQRVFEEILIKYIEYLVRKYKIRNMSAAGGIFLNIKANMKLLEEKIVDNLFVYPNPTDGGAALGAALIGFTRKGIKTRRRELAHPAYGRKYSNAEVLGELKNSSGITYKKLGKDLPLKVAKLLTEGKVIGWFQGRGEWGPRALGHRSVIADPRRLTMKNRINDILKGREWFMPFAPSILGDRAADYLVSLRKAPFMIIGDDATKLGLRDLKAAVHVDGTVRPHIVSKKVEPLYWQVINEFEKLTGVGAVLNTSFNKHGLPIVYSPKDAIEHLLWGTIDLLVIGGYLVERQNEK